MSSVYKCSKGHRLITVTSEEPLQDCYCGEKAELFIYQKEKVELTTIKNTHLPSKRYVSAERVLTLEEKVRRAVPVGSNISDEFHTAYLNLSTQQLVDYFKLDGHNDIYDLLWYWQLPLKSYARREASSIDYDILASKIADIIVEGIKAYQDKAEIQKLLSGVK